MGNAAHVKPKLPFSVLGMLVGMSVMLKKYIKTLKKSNCDNRTCSQLARLCMCVCACVRALNEVHGKYLYFVRSHAFMHFFFFNSAVVDGEKLFSAAIYVAQWINSAFPYISPDIYQPF